MALPLDHIVIAVQDLEAAVADYRALGFQVVIGGRHPGRTSHNALVVFADGAYLEIIAWTAPAPEERWYRTLRDHGEGLVDFALLPGSTSQALAEARGRGWTPWSAPWMEAAYAPTARNCCGRRRATPRPTCPSCAATSRRASCACPKAACASIPTARWA